MRNSHRTARKIARDVHTTFERVCDARFAHQHARKLLTPLYFVLLGATTYGLLWLVWATYQQSPWLGLVHLVAVLPSGVFGAAVFFRVFLELSEAVIEIREHAAELGTLPHRVSRWPAMRRLTEITVRRGWVPPPRS